MTMRYAIITILLVAMTAAVCAKRPVSDRPRKVFVPQKEMPVPGYAKGTVMVTPGDTVFAGMCVDSVIYSGFDKPASSDKESFLITNNGVLTLRGLEIEITYLTPDGRMLHRRVQTLECDVPAGETRKVDMRSFDSQHAYYYMGSSPGRSGASSFTVTFRTLKLYFMPK